MRKMAPAIICLLLCGCSALNQAKGPVLVSYSDQQRATISPAVQGNTYESIADRLANLPQEVYAGSNVYLSETVLNNGSPSKGIRILLKGSTISDGLFDTPQQASAKGIFADKSQASVEHDLELKPTAVGLQATDADLPYGSKLDINITLPAVRGGNGDLQLYVYPLDPNGRTSAVITHNYKILSETDDPQEIKVPGENE